VLSPPTTKSFGLQAVVDELQSTEAPFENSAPIPLGRRTLFSETPSKNAISGVTSLTLLERLKVREPDGWNRFCRVYGPLVYGWARHAGLQNSDASDVAQDVFLVVARRIAEFQRVHNRNFRNWLWTISHNVIQAHNRKLRNHPVAVGGTTGNLRFAELADIDSADHSGSEFDDRSGIVLRVLHLLREEVTESAWQAFWRTAVGGETASIVAADLGLTTWAVYKTKARLLHRVRLELDGLVVWEDVVRMNQTESPPRSQP